MRPPGFPPRSQRTDLQPASELCRSQSVWMVTRHNGAVRQVLGIERAIPAQSVPPGRRLDRMVEIPPKPANTLFRGRGHRGLVVEVLVRVGAIQKTGLNWKRLSGRNFDAIGDGSRIVEALFAPKRVLVPIAAAPVRLPTQNRFP